VGSFQSEIGCPPDSSSLDGDWEPGCLAAWLQDPDGDGLFVHRTNQIPPGNYAVKASKDLGWDGSLPAGDVPFTVDQAGDVVRFTLDPASGALGVTIEAPPVVPDLGTARATWVAPDAITMDVVDGDRRGWTYRLHYGPAGSLALDQESLGGSSIPLALEEGEPETLRLSREDARHAAKISWSGQLAVGVYDAAGRIVDATGVVVGDWGPPGRRR
jgi:hypothetical protein